MADLADVRIGIVVDDGDVVKSFKTFERMKRQLADLELALRKDELTQKQYNRAVQQMAVELGKVTGNLNAAKSSLMKWSRQLKSATDEQLKFQTVSGKGMRRFELIAQQAGYQFGDLAVQIQSGTNAAVAFGQQGSQLLGFFGPYGAIAGAGLAIATGLIAPLLRAKKAAEGAEKVFLSVSEAIEAVSKEATNAEQALLLLKSGFETVGELSLDREIKKLNQELSVAEEKLSGLQVAQLTGEAASASFDIVNLGKRLLGYETDPSALAQLMLDEEKRVIEEQIASLKEKLDLLVKNREELRKAQEEQAFNKLLEEQPNLTELRAKIEAERYAAIKSAEEAIAQAIEDSTKAREKEAAAAEKLKQLQDGLLTTAIQKLRLSDAEVLHGKDSSEYRKLELEYLLDNLKTSLELQGVDETIVNELVEMERLHQNNVDQLKDEAEQAKRLAEALKESASAMANLVKFGAGLDEKIAVARAQVNALKAGADAAVAGQIAGLKFELGQMAAADIAAGRSPDEVAAKYAGEYSKLNTLEGLLNQKGDLSSRDSGGRKETAEERLGALIKTAAFERTLIGVEEERATQLRRTQELTDMVRDSEGGLTEGRMKQIEQIVEMEAATRKLIEAEDARQQKIDSFADKMASALDSIVDGSATVEDAFKSMLRNMLMEIYQQEVSKPVAKFFGELLFSAKGNAFLGGRVTPFANGGVVNSPTFFPMANGAGLMGEAGPEAIMPLKRGPDGKLGVSGGGQTVINQTINVSTGVQQTVRNEIKSLMPQIAEQSKNAVLDAKRRGGSYGKRFA